MKEASGTITKEVAEVASEDEHTEGSWEAPFSSYDGSKNISRKGGLPLSRLSPGNLQWNQRNIQKKKSVSCSSLNNWENLLGM